MFFATIGNHTVVPLYVLLKKGRHLAMGTLF